MEYEGQICRSPMEKGSFMLPVSVGCSHNRCSFCMLFRHLQYRVLPPEEVKAEIERVQAVGGDPRRVFLGDGNAFSLSPERLRTILQWIRDAFPSCRSVAMDTRVQDIAVKSDHDLAELHALGVTDLYLGIECGLEDVLLSINKGNTLLEAEKAIERLHRAGIRYNAHIMTGICGSGRGEENALSLAAFLNRTRPLRICNFSLFLHRRSPLYQDVLAGRFIPADERENLIEELRLLENLESFETEYDGLHDFVPLRIKGNLPGAKDILCRKLRSAIEYYDAHPESVPVCIVE